MTVRVDLRADAKLEVAHPKHGVFFADQPVQAYSSSGQCTWFLFGYFCGTIWPNALFKDCVYYCATRFELVTRPRISGVTYQKYTNIVTVCFNGRNYLGDKGSFSGVHTPWFKKRTFFWYFLVHFWNQNRMFGPIFCYFPLLYLRVLTPTVN
jgi:hypothetical protein